MEAADHHWPLEGRIVQQTFRPFGRPLQAVMRRGHFLAADGAQLAAVGPRAMESDRVHHARAQIGAMRHGGLHVRVLARQAHEIGEGVGMSDRKRPERRIGIEASRQPPGRIDTVRVRRIDLLHGLAEAAQQPRRQVRAERVSRLALTERGPEPQGRTPDVCPRLRARQCVHRRGDGPPPFGPRGQAPDDRLQLGQVPPADGGGRVRSRAAGRETAATG